MPEWKAAKPFTYMLNEEAHAIICLLRLDEGGRDRAHFCPEIKEWSKQTGADEILVAMFHKLQGELARVRKAPIQTGTRTEKGASCFTIKREEAADNARSLRAAPHGADWNFLHATARAGRTQLPFSGIPL
jgi:hypothetical protein